ncbi:cell division protein FtsQ/DivIB [Acetobacter sp. AN02]|uniref:cell division protein FtsQ/DivIB n=1 Tax=Acetobacter sp. AN02 TaxID=2894186 RepID=UPI002434448D|nr:cell division protein FtsQ/DivIB [Acetobacter sp. AN02]MDG6094219.1 cell division protein FtsQ/DivIB [Acetobacter sp. AN02]
MHQPPPRERPSPLRLFASRHRRALQAGAFLLVLGAGTGALYAFGGVQKVMPSLRSGMDSRLALKVTSITITGNKLAGDDAIRKALGITVGDPLLEFDAHAAHDRISQIPFVSHASVERKFSGQIVVTITERPPFAIWQHDRQFILIDRNGDPLPDQTVKGKDAEAFLHLPLLVGAGANKEAATLVDALEKEPDIRDHMTAATLVSQRRWTLLMKNGTRILLPEAEETPALERLSELNRDMKLLDIPVEQIDLRLPDRLTIQKSAQAEPQAVRDTDRKDKDTDRQKDGTPPSAGTAGHPAAAEPSRPGHPAPPPAAGRHKDQPREEQRAG